MSARSFRSTPRSRDRNRLAVSAVTGVVTVVALTATGLLVGVAAADFEAEQAEREAAQAKAERQRARYDRQVTRATTASAQQEGLRERPTRIRVTTRYVTPGATQSVGGGHLNAPTQSPNATTSNRDPGSNTSGTSTAPAPPPPPATTSGS